MQFYDVEIVLNSHKKHKSPDINGMIQNELMCINKLSIAKQSDLFDFDTRMVKISQIAVIYTSFPSEVWIIN
jgi:hypothetical protein